MTPNDLASLDRVSRRALRMYDLTERERRICEVIIDWSFGRGREEAVIPSLEVFVDLTGLDKGDVSKTFKLLFARRIVQRRGPRDARVYSFLPFATYWQETRPLFDPERAARRAAELDRINGQGKLPVEEADLEDGMAMVSREEALVEEQAADMPWPNEERTGEIGGSPIGKTPTTWGVGDLPISGSALKETRTRAPGTTLNNVSINNVNNVAVGETPTRRLGFADPEKKALFEQLESIAGGEDFDRYRGAWVNRVRNYPTVLREALGDLKLFRANSRNRLRKPAGAWIFQRAKTIAREMGRDFR